MRIRMVANWEEKVPQVTLSRLEEIFPEILKNGTVHVTNVAGIKKVGETGALLSKKPGVHSKVSPPTTKTEARNAQVRDNLVLQAIAVNRNRLLYNPHVCPACKMIFKNKGRLMMHLEMHFIKKKLGKKTKVLAEKKKKKALRVHNVNARGRVYSCNFCGEVYMNEVELVAHKVTHFKENYGCPVCDLTFRTTIYLNIHIESVHIFSKRKSSSFNSPVQHKSDPSKVVAKVKAVKQK